MRVRLPGPRIYKLNSPLNIEECRSRLTGGEGTPECGVVQMPGRRGVVRATTLFIEDEPPGDVSAAFSGTMTSTGTGTFISLRDETSRMVYESGFFTGGLASVAAYLQTLKITTDPLSILMIALMYAMAVGFIIRTFTRKRESRQHLVDAIRDLLESHAPSPHAAVGGSRAQAESNGGWG